MMKRGIYVIILLVLSVLGLQAQIVVESVVTTPVSCGGDSDGTITVTVTGGSGDFSYQLWTEGFVWIETIPATPNLRTAVFNAGYAKGGYFIFITDTDPAPNATAVATIGGPSVINISGYSSTNLTCSSASDGTITITASGEEGNLEYDLTGPTPKNQNNGNFTGLSAGSYDVLVSDADGCPSTDAVLGITLTEPSGIIISNINTTDATCFEGSNGAISLDVAGGSPSGVGDGYTYVWTGPGTFSATTQDISGLAAGDYSLTVTDGNSCTQNSGTITVGEGSEITLPSVIANDASCYGYTDGDVTITVAGGTGPYTFTWTGQNTGTTRNIQNPNDLPKDTYDLEVVDAFSCSKDFIGIIAIDEPIAISAVENTSTPANCFGNSDGSADINVSNGSAPYTFLWSGPSAYSSTEEDPTLMPAGTFSVEVTDNNGCILDFPNLITITEPNDILASLDNSSDVLCNGGSNGSAELTASEGTPGYTYLWTGDGSGHTSVMEDPNDLVADVYDLEITDNNSCVKTFDNIVAIGQPAAIFVGSSITDAGCFESATGEIDVTVLGGMGPYTFEWTGPDSYTNNTEDITGLKTGNYFLKVTDNNGCEKNEGPYFVDESPEIIINTVSSSDVTCFGGDNGTATITLSGGVAPYTFSWDGAVNGDNSTAQDPIDLEADTYTLTVTDNDGCPKIFSNIVVISEPTEIAVTPGIITDVLCFGDATGSATIATSGGNGPYTYLWSGPSAYSSSEENPTLMPAGDFSVEVTDNNSCIKTFNDIITVNQPNDMIAVLDGSADVLCNGGSDGTAQVTVTEGTPGYTYLWTGDGTGHTSTMEDPNDLMADVYDLEVTDNNTCVKTFDNLAAIGQPASIFAGASITDVNCFGDASGEIDVTVLGGTGPYTFNWSDGGTYTANTEDISSIPAGTYDLTITDNNLCTYDLNNNVVDENAVLDATFITSDLGCNGISDGTIDATVTGGVGPYIFSWTGPGAFSENTEDISALAAGDYTLSVEDALGCTMSFNPQTVSEPTAIVATFTSTNPLCYQSDDGTINIDVSGGNPAYTYSWTSSNGFISADEDISALAPGDYSLTINDSKGCSVIYTDEITLTEPTGISLSSTKIDITCNGSTDGSIDITASGGTVGTGYTYSWTGPSFVSTDEDISGLAAGDYNLTITDANACSMDFIPVETIIEPSGVTAILTAQTDLLCNGDSDGNISIDVAGGTAPYTFSWSNSLGTEISTDEDPIDLTADTYTVTITDASLCSKDFTDIATINEPAALSLSLSKTDILCAGETNGTITATPAGGTPTYEYSQFSGGPWQSEVDFTGLSSGTYNIYIQDINGCKTFETIAINEPASISYEYGVTGQNVCNGDADVAINIFNVTGGVEPYQYSIDGGTSYQDNGEFLNNPAGAYPVVVRDANSCEKSILPLSIIEPLEIKITYYDTDDITTCFDDEAGRIAIQGGGGTSPLVYSINDGPTQATGEFIDIEGGIYKVSIIDDNACQKDTTMEILRPDELIFNPLIFTDVAGCPGDNTGSIDITATGGSGLIEYSFDGTTYGGTQLLENLIAGEYTVYAKDGNGCIIDSTNTITEPAGMSIDSESATDVSCNGLLDGTITVEVSGGTAPYTYTLNPPILPPQNNATFTNLPPLDYTVEINDFEGCGPVVSGTLTVGEPTEIIVEDLILEEISCNGSNDASITISVSGGTPPYQYSVDNQATYQSDSVFTNLIPGSYDVFAMDASGCPIPGISYTFNEPAVLSLSASKIDVSPCYGDTSGSISSSASGGWNDYEYSIDGINFQVSGDFSDLIAGDYNIFTRDTGKCTATIPITIDEPIQLTATVEKTNYDGADLGTITISNAAGGNGNYTYSINGIAGPFTTETSYTDLLFGSYDVIVMDDLLCVYEETVEILEIIPIDMDLNVVHVECNGEASGSIEFVPLDGVGTVYYSIDSGANYVTTPLFENLPGDSTYNLMAYDDDNKQYTQAMLISQPTPILFYNSTTEAVCNAFSATGSNDLTITGGTAPYTISWSNGSSDEDLVNVNSGYYYLDVTDDNGCNKKDTVFIPSQVTVVAGAGNDTTICAGQTILLNGIPGDIVEWAPATYLTKTDVYNPVALSISEDITYIYRVRETTSGNSCYNEDTLNVSVLPTYGIEVIQDTFAIEGQSLQLGATTSGTFVSYEWNPEAGLNFNNIIDPIAFIQNSITYILYATNDLGCIETDTVYIEMVEDIHVYNAFSPNDDLINDYFDIDNAERFPEIVVEVYNVWGSKLFSTVGYGDDQRWDGTFNGTDVPTGTYYYVVIPFPDATPITGNVTIIR